MAYTDEPLIQPPPDEILITPGNIPWPSMAKPTAVLQRGFQLYFSHFGDLVKIALVAFLPIDIGIALVNHFVTDSLTSSFLTLILNILTGILSCLVVPTVVCYINAILVQGRKLTVGEAFHAGTERWGKTIGMTIMVGLICLLYSLLLIIPGIIASLRLYLATILVTLEPNSDARDRSSELTNGHRWLIFQLSFAFGLLMLLCAVPIYILIYAFNNNFFVQLLLNLYQSLLAPLNVVIAISVYYSLIYHRRDTFVPIVPTPMAQADYIPPPYQSVDLPTEIMPTDAAPAADIATPTVEHEEPPAS